MHTPLDRRQWLQQAGSGFGMLGLADLMANADSGNPMSARSGHFAPRAKRVIWIFVNGGPSHVDTWDYKPALSR
ncbi:MAG: hypothetical protein ACI8W8_003326, partial [Rhodothermales bacterium]